MYSRKPIGNVPCTKTTNLWKLKLFQILDQVLICGVVSFNPLDLENDIFDDSIQGRIKQLKSIRKCFRGIR